MAVSESEKQTLREENITWQSFLSVSARFDKALDISASTGLAVCFVVYLINLGRELLTPLKVILNAYIQTIEDQLRAAGTKKSWLGVQIDAVEAFIEKYETAAAPYLSVLQRLQAGQFDGCPDLAAFIKPLNNLMDKAKVGKVNSYRVLLEGLTLEVQRIEQEISNGELAVTMFRNVVGTISQIGSQVFGVNF